MVERLKTQRAAQHLFKIAGVAIGLAGLAGCAAPSAETGQALAFAPVLSAQSLVGATPALLSAEFGKPALRRVDGAAQVWLYHSPVCGLNLILYPDRSGTPRVADAVPDNGDAASCAASLQHSTTAVALEHPASS
ncbi:MAG: hypothetical protein B7Z81_11400 [Acidocella sp. 20-61-6]|nr:MAG: hypothetical protein B7Z81_11400 [Acidocella sp. 20-61-6]